jgi:hypothetical protein
MGHPPSGFYQTDQPGVVIPVTSEYDVPSMVARGYAGLSFLRDAAKWIDSLEVPTFIYHPRRPMIRPALVPARSCRHDGYGGSSRLASGGRSVQGQSTVDARWNERSARGANSRKVCSICCRADLDAGFQTLLPNR